MGSVDSSVAILRMRHTTPMPMTAAQTTTAMAALPTRPVAAGDAQVIEVHIKYMGGKTFDAAALRTALATLGTVVLTDEGGPRPLGPYRFMIS